MKQHIRTIIATVTLLFTTLGVWANGTIVKVIKLNGTEVSSMSPGTVTVSENGTTRTITITPSKGYYLIKNGVSALRTITTNTPSVRNKTPGIDEGTITISGEYPTDLSGETSLTFTMPESPYDVEITADFGNRIDITNATLTLDNNEYTYDGTAKTPSVTLVTTSEGTEYTLTAGTDYTADYSNNTNVPENANSPQPTVTITGISQYTGTATQTFTINKAAASLTAPTAKELTYTGAAQELINTGSSNDGEMQYKLSTDTEWSTSIPKGTDKGTYTVNYKVIGDANHNDTESADVQVTIGAKSIANATITLSKESFDYNGETQKPEVTSVKDGETSLTANKDYTITNEGGKDVNTYTVSITGTGNYTGTATKDFTINKVAASLTAPTAKELTYTGAAQELINTGSSNDGEMQYKLSTDTEWSTSIPKGTDKGTYTVNYKVIGDANHNDTESADVQVTIGAKSIANATVTLSAESFDYNGETQKPEVSSVKDGETTLTAGEDYTVTNEGGKDVGTYTVTITGTGNYTGTATKNFTIGKVAATIATAPTAKELTYTGVAQELVNAGSTNDGEMQYKLSTETTWSTNIPTATNQGTYTVNYRVVGDINHYDSEIGEVTITINRAAAIVTKAPAAIENLKASGEDQVLITAGEAEGGEMYYSLDGTNYSTELPKALEEGKYTIYYKVIADENHYDTEPSTIEVTMAEGVKAYKVWVGDNRITGKNANDVNGDDATNGGGSFQYFENNNTLFIIGNTSGAEIKSEDPEGLTIYLFANSTNKLSSITGKGKLIITTDGNFPGSLELEGTENVISGFSSIELQENLAIINPEGIAYTNETLATKYALIGVPVEPFVEMKHEEFAGDDWNKNPDGTENDLTNFIYDDRVLFTLKFTQEADGDGVDDDGSVVLNTPMSSDEIKKIIESDLTPGSGEFAEAFTGITILIPAGEGVIEIDGRTQDGYILGVRSLFTNELIELRQSKNEEREIMVFEYKFSQPTFVGIYNYGKASAARGIGRAKKTVGSVTIHGISVKPRQLSAANCAKQASNGSYAPPTGGDTSEASGQLPPYGQDPDHPDIVSGITNVETNVTANDKWYNLNGQQIDKPTQKGLYIYKGKKIFVK